MSDSASFSNVLFPNSNPSLADPIWGNYTSVHSGGSGLLDEDAELTRLEKEQKQKLKDIAKSFTRTLPIGKTKIDGLYEEAEDEDDDVDDDDDHDDDSNEDEEMEDDIDLGGNNNANGGAATTAGAEPSTVAAAASAGTANETPNNEIANNADTSEINLSAVDVSPLQGGGAADSSGPVMDLSDSSTVERPAPSANADDTSLMEDSLLQ